MMVSMFFFAPKILCYSSSFTCFLLTDHLKELAVVAADDDDDALWILLLMLMVSYFRCL